MIDAHVFVETLEYNLLRDIPEQLSMNSLRTLSDSLECFKELINAVKDALRSINRGQNAEAQKMLEDALRDLQGRV